MAVRGNTENALNEDSSEEEEESFEGNGAEDIQERLDRHALVNHGKQIAEVQGQLTEVMSEIGSLRKLCTSARDSAKETNLMLKTLGNHLGVQLKTVDVEPDEGGE